jgi:hypothetical protein
MGQEARRAHSFCLCPISSTGRRRGAGQGDYGTAEKVGRAHQAHSGPDRKRGHSWWVWIYSLTPDSPDLDPRLSHLRRASQLSAKASLFVLTPVPADQLPEFVQSLQDALYDSSMEYYGNLAKRVRRKRTRSTELRWEVRYDFKAGWFAEIRGEDATRHYEDCWNKLAKMFSSTQMLTPRTKRWAEAKVLADCVAMRVSTPLIELIRYVGFYCRIHEPWCRLWST